jgi:hypothetical protein
MDSANDKMDYKVPKEEKPLKDIIKREKKEQDESDDKPAKERGSGEGKIVHQKNLPSISSSDKKKARREEKK